MKCIKVGLGCTDPVDPASCSNQRSISRAHEGCLFYS